MKYVDTSAVLRLLFGEPGPALAIATDDRVVSSELLEVEAFRAIERLRLLGGLTDEDTAVKRKELTDLVAMLDLMPMDRAVIDRAKAPSGSMSGRSMPCTWRRRKCCRPRPANAWSSGRTTNASVWQPCRADSPSSGSDGPRDHRPPSP